MELYHPAEFLNVSCYLYLLTPPKTVSQLAREYAVHPTQVTQWRATIRDHMPELFEPGQPGTEYQEELIAQLHQKIGQLTVDLDWLKKKSKQLGL
jgi:transposase-like protein